MSAILHCKMNGDGNDASGNGLDLTLVGSPTFAAGKIGQAVTFDGATQHAYHADHALFNVGAKLTVCAWIKTTYTGASLHYAIGQYDGGDNQRSWAMAIYQTGGRLRVQLSPDGTNTAARYTAGLVSDGNWHHVAFIYDGTQADADKLRLFVDGQEQAYAASGTPPTSLHNSTAALTLGGILNNGELVSPLACTLDDVRIYNEVLDLDAIQSIYNSGNGIEASYPWLRTPITPWYHSRIRSFDGCEDDGTVDFGDDDGDGPNVSGSMGWDAGDDDLFAFDMAVSDSIARVLEATSERFEEDDRLMLRTTGATTKYDRLVSLSQTRFARNEPITVSSSDESIALPIRQNHDTWKLRHGDDGTAAVTAASDSFARETRLEFFSTAGETSETLAGGVVGSLRKHIEEQIDSRIAGKNPATTKRMWTTTWQEHNEGTFARNADCWAADIDMTPESPWNSDGKAYKSGTLIAPRFFVGVYHYRIAVGSTVKWVAADDSVVTRTVTGRTDLIAGQDLSLYLIESPVTYADHGVSFAKLLPEDYRNYLPPYNFSWAGVPVWYTDFEGKALVGEVYGETMNPQVPYRTSRSSFYEVPISGDSGNPWAMIVNGELVLMGCLSCFLRRMSHEVSDTTLNAAMATLLPDPLYTVTAADFSEFNSYG